MPSMHQTSLHETAQRPPSPWPVPKSPEGWYCQHQQCRCRWERSQQMLATSVHGSQSMADRVLGMCSVPKPLCTVQGCAGQLCSNNLWAVVKTGSSHKQVSTAAAACCSCLGIHNMTLHPHRACAVCLDTLVLLSRLLHTLSVCCCLLREPCTHATARTSLPATKECSRHVWRRSSMTCCM
jgi:hypothetical protein